MTRSRRPSSARSSRPTGTATGPSPSARPPCRPAPTGWRSPWSRRPSSCVDAGIDAPILLLSQPRLDDLAAAVRFDLRVTVYTDEAVDAVATAAEKERRLARVHLKVDTGMNRVGARPEAAVGLAQRPVEPRQLELEGVFTHCAVADEPDNPFTDVQLDRFEAVIAELDEVDLRPPMLHAANSAGGLAPVRARYDLVRAGIAVYGMPPAAGAGRLHRPPTGHDPASQVSMVKRVAAGEGISYGLRHVFDRESTVATVPVGLRRRGAPTPRGGRWRGAGRRPATADRRGGHHGPAHGRLRRRSGGGRRRGRAHRRAGRRGDHAPRSGPSGSTRSPTRSCAASAPVSRGATADPTVATDR